MSIRIITGHVLNQLAELPPESVHCVVTSPPYYGLRDYGIEPQVWAPMHKKIAIVPGGDCQNGHWWGDEGTIKIEVSDKRQHSRSTPEDAATDRDALMDGRPASQGAFCRRCGAWRGSLGLEPTLNLYLDHMVDVFRAVRRVLRKDGTCWLNIGDSYCSSQPGNKTVGVSAKSGLHGVNNPSGVYRETLAAGAATKRDTTKAGPGLKPKDLMLVPARLVIRLQEDGWWVRSHIAWCKRAPMPESATDRPTSAWEHVFLLTKSARYYYDAEAVKEESESDHSSGNKQRKPAGLRGIPGASTTDPNGGVAGSVPWQQQPSRNMRNFWLLGPSPYPEAHFATFPPEIPRRAILAGTSERGVCPKCSAPWARVTKTSRTRDGEPLGGSWKTDEQKIGPSGVGHWRDASETETIGWRPTCQCPDAGQPRPATVLDCFLGSGTTAMVADQLQRDCIGIELGPQYAEMAERRIRDDNSLFAEITANPEPTEILESSERARGNRAILGVGGGGGARGV